MHDASSVSAQRVDELEASMRLTLLLLSAAALLDAQQQIMPVPEHVPVRCSDLNRLYDRLATINAACCPPEAPCADGQPTACSVDCAVAFKPVWEDCAHVIDTLSQFDAADGTRDGTASVFRPLKTLCDSSVSSADVLSELQSIWEEGYCPDEMMEGMARTNVTATSCEDTRDNCHLAIDSGFVSCDADFCPTCGLAGQCDLACGFCTVSDDDKHGHRLLQLAGAHLGHPCNPETFAESAEAVDSACCADVGCSGGVPTACDAKCGVVYVDFYARCSPLLAIYAPTDLDAYSRLEVTSEHTRAPCFGARF